MKIIYLFLLPFLLLICSSCKQEPPEDIPNFNGHWKWIDTQEGKQIFELTLQQKGDQVEGFYCAILESPQGQLIDCGYQNESSYNLKGSIQKGALITQIISPLSQQSGKASIRFVDDQILWKIFEKPGKGSLCPIKAKLEKDDRQKLRFFPKEGEYQWEVPNDKKYGERMYGKWLLTDFFDSTIIHKTLYRYFDQPAANFAVVLDLDPLRSDSIYQVGIMESMQFKIEKLNPYKIAIDDYISNAQLWYDPTFDLLAYRTNNGQTTNYYRHVDRYDYEVVSPEMEDYFNTIIKGTYQIIAPEKYKKNKLVTFGEAYEVDNLKDFRYYNLSWLKNPDLPSEFDAVFLKKKKSAKDGIYMHWELDGDTLLLYHLNKIKDNKSGLYTYTIKEKAMELVKQY